MIYWRKRKGWVVVFSSLTVGNGVKTRIFVLNKLQENHKPDLTPQQHKLL